jgi:hypothetical protein
VQQYTDGARGALLGSEANEREHLVTLSRRLYILAWIIEGIAVVLGLGMALTLNQPGESTAVEFFLAGGGFVMVACAELSKIPLATYFVQAASWRAKCATLAFLVLMSVITFETIFFSLERGFNTRLLAARSQAEEISRLKTDRDGLTRFIENPGADFEAKRLALDRQQSEIDASFKNEIAAVEQRRASLLSQRRDSALPNEISEQIQALEAKRPLLLQERDQKLAAISERGQQELRSLHNQLAAARRQNDQARYEETSGRIRSAKAKIEKEKARAESDYQRQLSELQASIAALTATRFELVRDNETASKPGLDDLSKSAERIHSEYGRKREGLSKERSNLHAAETAAGQDALRKRDRRNDLASQVERKEAQYRNATAESQLHRVAATLSGWWTGKEYEPHTVPIAYIGRVSSVWFGSMAALGALGGAVVAMISQLLVKGTEKTSPSRTERATGGSRFARFLFTLTLMRRLWSRVKIKTAYKFVGVPVPVSGVSLGELQTKFDALQRPLSELPDPRG